MAFYLFIGLGISEESAFCFITWSVICILKVRVPDRREADLHTLVVKQLQMKNC